MERFAGQQFIDMLPTRTLADLRSLHLVQANKQFYCLDLSLKSATLDALHLLCLSTLGSLSKSDVLPSAPDRQWAQIIGMKLLKLYRLKFLTDHGWLGVALLEGNFVE